MSPRVSAEHKELRRQAILDGALKVFLTKGYQLSTIDDISAEVGLSVGAIYRYFQGKSDIIVCLVDERLGRTPELFTRLTERAGSPLERLDWCIQLFTHALQVRYPATGRLLLVTLAEAVQDGKVRQGLLRRFGSLVSYLTGIIKEGAEQGLFRRDVDPVALASLLLCMADGVAIYWVTGASDLDLRSMRSTVSQMVRCYLQPKE